VNEAFSPNANATPRRVSTSVFLWAGSSLLAHQRTRTPALDVQHRPARARARPVFREAAAGAGTCYLDHTRDLHVVLFLCGDVGRVFKFSACARRRPRGRGDRPQDLSHGSTLVALCLRLVVARAVDFAFRDRAEVERQRGARNSTGVGTNVPFLLDVLARADDCDGSGALVVGIALADALAGS